MLDADKRTTETLSGIIMPMMILSLVTTCVLSALGLVGLTLMIHLSGDASNCYKVSMGSWEDSCMCRNTFPGRMKRPIRSEHRHEGEGGGGGAGGDRYQ